MSNGRWTVELVKIVDSAFVLVGDRAMTPLVLNRDDASNLVKAIIGTGILGAADIEEDTTSERGRD